MATPTAFTADMLKEMAEALEDYQPRQSLLMSAGFREALAKEAPAIIGTGRSNPLIEGYTQSYAGISIVPADIPPEEVIDWSGCRSPSRAKRRHARGIPQRIKVEYRDRAYLINRRALALGREIDERLLAGIYDAF